MYKVLLKQISVKIQVQTRYAQKSIVLQLMQLICPGNMFILIVVFPKCDVCYPRIHILDPKLATSM